MSESLDTPSRFIIGIDLGTTNSSVAFVDTTERPWRVRDFPLPQLVAPSTVEGRETLPSFHYQAAPGEFAPGALNLPWSSADEAHAVGFFARDHGALVPGRLVVSAKSWLCHGGIDRTAGLLPWHGADDVERLSPVEVSSRYLAHIRAAWDHEHPEDPIARQEVVLTVPASFDEVARELTVEAARQAGLVKLTLVEEPQAAFYAWINSQGDDWQRQVHPGQKILVADIGGGTTDFTLIRVKGATQGDEGTEARRHEGTKGKTEGAEGTEEPRDGVPSDKLLFHRIAVGQHLILGGDNLDLAIAHHIENKAVPGGKLPPRQWGPLLRSARVIKETFLGENPPPNMTVNLSAGGSKLIGGARQVEVSRAEIQALLLEGFLPATPLDAKPITRRSGFQEFNLPYAPDPAITKYLAAFLTAHRDAYIDEDRIIHLEHDPARPDILLFNGGFFASPLLRQRFLEVLASWFQMGEEGTEARRHEGTKGMRGGAKGGEASFAPSPEPTWRPQLLANDRLDLAVSRGAAYYGMVRRGHGVRISGGLAHSYYVGVDAPGAAAPQALCLLPAGVEEGHDVRLDRTFNLLIRQPVEFPLYISATRTTDLPGALVEIDPEQLTALPPIRTVLQSGRKSVADTIPVNLHARLTEIGTLELWAAEKKGDREWRLNFDVRSATRAEVERHTGRAEIEGFVDAQVITPAQALIRSAFSPAHAAAAPAIAPAEPAPFHLPTLPTPATLVKRLELVTAQGRLEWPSSLLRSFWEALMEVQEGRRQSVDHEARWLNLTGFCLRPGYGLAVDDWRVAQTWRLFTQKVQNPRNELCRAEWWILWRRIAGGLSAGQQLTLAEPLIAAMKSRLRAAGPVAQGKSSSFQYGPHESAEVWRLLGSLELLKSPVKIELGETILDLLPREKALGAQTAALFALGRLGARVPVYAGLNDLLPPEVVEPWIGRLLATAVPAEPSGKPGQLLFTLVQLSRRTDDRYRDLSAPVREAVLSHLRQQGAPAHYLQLVGEGGQLEAEEQKLTFGEPLPRGLRIE